jgi:quercetin dioxygenase-like cupin family protein
VQLSAKGGDERVQPREDRTMHVAPEEGRELLLAGDRITLKLVGKDSNNALLLAEEVTPPGGGPPPHVHRNEDETFYILDGEFAFSLGDAAIRAAAGSVVHAPRNVPHGFTNIGALPGRMLVIVTPAGFEAFLEEAGEETVDGSSPPSFGQVELEKLLAAAAKYGVEIRLPVPESSP